MAARSARPTLAFVPARYYHALVRFLGDRGYPARRVLEGTGLSADVLAGDDSYLGLDEVETLVLRAAALVPGEEMALALGRSFEVPSHGALGLAALTAKDVGAALEVACRYFGLVIPFFELELDASGDPLRIRVRARWALEPRVERFHLLALRASLEVQSRLVLRGPLPGGVEVEVHGPVIEARIPAALAAVPLPLAHAPSHAQACRTCDGLLAARPDPARFASVVRRALERSGPPFPDLEAVARTLRTSPRTVRRRLASEGTRFRALLEEARLARAEEWLALGERSITEIGLDLGYSDGANFTRAYRRARGRPPLAARRAVAPTGQGK